MKPKILLFDIETRPMEVFVWSLGDQHVGLEQIKEDWSILSWAAKWKDKKQIIYRDLRDARNVNNDKLLLGELWKLLDEADIVITQNGKKFDSKKVNARFIQNGMKKPSSYRHIDTLQISRKVFGFTSNKLAYTTENLNKKYKKLEHKKFPGLSLWKECLNGNLSAWKEMELYNKHDVLALDELYETLKSWDSSIELNIYNEDLHNRCSCGSGKLTKYGFAFTNTGKFQRYICTDCGSETRARTNILSKEKRESLRNVR